MKHFSGISSAPLAVAFAVAALGAEGSSTIRESDCVGNSYPDFFKALERTTER